MTPCEDYNQHTGIWLPCPTREANSYDIPTPPPPAPGPNVMSEIVGDPALLTAWVLGFFGFLVIVLIAIAYFNSKDNSGQATSGTDIQRMGDIQGGGQNGPWQ